MAGLDKEQKPRRSPKLVLDYNCTNIISTSKSVLLGKESSRSKKPGSVGHLFLFIKKRVGNLHKKSVCKKRFSCGYY